VVAAGLEDVGKAYDVALDVGVGVCEGVAHTGLGCEVADAAGFVLGENTI